MLGVQGIWITNIRLSYFWVIRKNEGTLNKNIFPVAYFSIIGGCVSVSPRGRWQNRWNSGCVRPELWDPLHYPVLQCHLKYPAELTSALSWSTALKGSLVFLCQGTCACLFRLRRSWNPGIWVGCQGSKSFGAPGKTRHLGQTEQHLKKAEGKRRHGLF